MFFKNKDKCKFFTILAAILIMLTFFSNYIEAKDKPGNPDAISFLNQFASEIRQASKSVDLHDQFVADVKKLLSIWEKEAPEEVKKDIEILKSKESVSSTQAAERIAKIGTYAKGASKALIITLGDRVVMRPGDLLRLFGAKDTTPGKEASQAFVSMEEWAIPALILSLEEDYQEYKEDPEAGDYANMLAIQSLMKITGENHGKHIMHWITWFFNTYDPQ